MPQLDFTVFINEVTWVILVSAFTYLIYSNYFIPAMFKLIQFLHIKLVLEHNIKLNLGKIFYLQIQADAENIIKIHRDVILYFLKL